MGRGGQNKTHDIVENALRLDSFLVGNLLGGYEITWPGGDVLDLEGLGGAVRLSYSVRDVLIRERFTVSRVPNHYGGARPFLICPSCGRRVRFLYLRGSRFRCRYCAALNYKVQQAGKNEFIHYRAAVKLLRKCFRIRAAELPRPIDLEDFFPERPKGMRCATYWRLLEAYQRLVNQFMDVMAYRNRALFPRRE